MSQSFRDLSLSNHIQNVRSQMSKISSAYEGSDTPLNNYLEEKYELSKYSPYNTGNSYSNVFENSYAADNIKEEASHYLKPTMPSSHTKYKDTTTNDSVKIYKLESRINELQRIQETLIKSLEDNKKSALRSEQVDKKCILELREKLALANVRISNFEEAQKTDNKEKLLRYIKELEITAENLKLEKSSLIQKLLGIGEDLNCIEGQSRSMQNDIQLLKHQNAALQSEIASLKSERLESLKSLDCLSAELSQKTQLIQTQLSEISAQSARISDLKSLISSISSSKLSDPSFKLDTSNFQLRLSQLSKENELLKSKISSRPSANEIQLTKKKIENLEKVVDSLQLSSTIPNRSKSCEKKFAAATCFKVLRELMQEIGVDSPFGLVEVFRKVARENRIAVKNVEIVEKMKDLVVKCSPPESFVGGLSVKKVWKWMKRLTDEYFRLKKDWEGAQAALKVMEWIKIAIGVKDEGEVQRMIGDVMVDYEYHKLLINKTKVMMRMNNAMLKDFEAELDRRL